MKNLLLLPGCYRSSVACIVSKEQIRNFRHEAGGVPSMRFNGDIGIYIKDLRNGKRVSINADTIFPTARSLKCLFVGIMDKLKRSELYYDSSLVYKDSLLYEGEEFWFI